MENGRISTLDAVRGIAIISMVIGHVANYSFLWRTSHFAYYVWDGASLFMLVSGIVVGIVYRKRIHRGGMRFAAVKQARRAGLLYLIQLGLVLLALGSAYLMQTPGSEIFLIPGLDSFASALPWALALGINPIYVNFLSTYVVVLLAAIPALWLLARGRVAALVGVLVALYVVGLMWPMAFTLPNGPLEAGTFNNATWFVLFGTGLLAGWFWRESNVHAHLMSRRVLWIAGPIFAVLLALAVWDALPSEPGQVLDWLTDKDLMGPLRLLAAWAFFIAAYWVMTEVSAQRWGATPVNCLAILGSRALDAIVILTLATIALQGLFGMDSSSRLAQLTALGVIAVEWGWARVRTQRPCRVAVISS